MPTLTVIAGPNGSGKSTLTDLLLQQGVRFGEYLNADDVARTLHGIPEVISAQAQQIVRDKRNAALAEGRDHTFETVSHVSHIEYMLEAKRQGFAVELYFVATDDPVINLDRVANRIAHGGHDVPKDRIVNRYERCLGNLSAAMAAADGTRIHDNSSSDRPLRPLADISQGGSATILSHLDIGRLDNGEIDPDDIPIWWLEILLRIKPDDPFTSGRL